MKPFTGGPKDVKDEAVSRLLDQLPLEVPPEDLKDNVLRAIGTRPEPARSGWFEALRAGVRGRWLAEAVPFAAGAALASLVFAVALGSGFWRGSGTTTVGGAMAPFHGAGGGAGAGRKTDDQRFELGRANVRFEVFRSGDRALVSIHSDAADSVEITIQVPEGGSRLERLTTVPSAPGGVVYGPGRVRIRNSGRDQAEVGLVLESGAGDAPISITVQTLGGTVQGALHTNSSTPAEKFSGGQ